MRTDLEIFIETVDALKKAIYSKLKENENKLISDFLELEK